MPWIKYIVLQLFGVVLKVSLSFSPRSSRHSEIEMIFSFQPTRPKLELIFVGLCPPTRMRVNRMCVFAWQCWSGLFLSILFLFESVSESGLDLSLSVYLRSSILYPCSCLSACCHFTAYLSVYLSVYLLACLSLWGMFNSLPASTLPITFPLGLDNELRTGAVWGWRRVLLFPQANYHRGRRALCTTDPAAQHSMDLPHYSLVCWRKEMYVLVSSFQLVHVRWITVPNWRFVHQMLL